MFGYVFIINKIPTPLCTVKFLPSDVGFVGIREPWLVAALCSGLFGLMCFLANVSGR